MCRQGRDVGNVPVSPVSALETGTPFNKCCKLFLVGKNGAGGANNRYKY